jgi:hypothetical protein
VNTDCVVAASSSALSVVVSVGLALFLLFLPQQRYVPDPTKVVGVWRRFGAFFLDFAFVLLIASPLAALPILLAEASHSGTFVWSFQRVFSRPTDSAYLLPGVFAVFVALFLYFYLHPRVQRPTIGQVVLGYRVEPADGNSTPRYGIRVVMSFIGLCAWPVSVILALRRADKAFWWDGATATGVVRVAAASNRMQRTREG